MREEKENHQKAFRGCWCPPELFDLLSEGNINTQEFTLLLTIDSFVQSKGEDCWCSNAYLAKRIGVSINRVAQYMGGLKSKGYAIQTGFDGRNRFVHVFWSRPNNAKQRNGSSSENATPPVAKTQHREDIRLEEEESHPAVAGNGTPIKGIPSRFRRIAKQLFDALTKQQKAVPAGSVAAWAKSIYGLHKKRKVSTQRIKAAMDWYCAQLPARYHAEFFFVIESGDSFYRKFSPLEKRMHEEMMDAGEMDREDPEEPGDNETPEVIARHTGKTMTDAEWDKFQKEN